eukprot:gb/GECG01001940.1/.p1 GENE.gb/GECG01001940.1/~~gb/GECG01001940.1/.p1  ORF type:complete len:358 (+),score=20.86 gb/GECG01001940.1/:1-1074(+)
MELRSRAKSALTSSQGSHLAAISAENCHATTSTGHHGTRKLLISPVSQKNRWILRGYRTHESLKETLEHWSSLTNETLNIYTATLQAILVLYIALHLIKYEDCSANSDSKANECLLDGARPLLIFAQTLHFVGMVCVLFYHTVCTIASLYHFASACDLVGVSLSALAMAVSLAAARVGVWPLPHTMNYLNVGESEGYLMRISSVLENQIAAIENVILHTMSSDEKWISDITANHHGLVLFVCYSCFCMLIVFMVRIRMRREAPIWLLTLNVLPALLVTKAYMFHHKLYMALGDEHNAIAFAIFTFGGIAVFKSKAPERLFPNVFDYVGNSHQLWHILYIVGLGILTHDVLKLVVVQW